MGVDVVISIPFDLLYLVLLSLFWWKTGVRQSGV